MEIQLSELVDIIFTGGSDYEDSAHLHSLYSAYKENQQGKSSSECKDYTGDTQELLIPELLEILTHKKNFRWIPVPEIIHQRFQKNGNLSNRLRDRGNVHMQNEEHQEALRSFNLAMAFALPNSLELALALERRAELLLKLGHFDLAQLDIHSVAGNTSYPMKLGYKLIELQNRCTRLSLSAPGTLGNEACVKMELDDKCRRAARKYAEAHLFTLQSREKGISNVTQGVAIDRQAHCGRRIVVTRNFKPGDVIMIDDPYALVLERIIMWDVEHCTNCSKIVISGVPCDCCTFAWFCSTACKLEACRKMHKYEKYLSYVKCNKIMSLKAFLAAKILFKVGPDFLYKIFCNRNPLYFSEDSNGFDDAGNYNSNSYLPIFHLISHPHADQLKSASNSFKALVMTHLIEDTSVFFQRYRYNDNYEDFKDFISALLLRHMNSIEYNAITLSQIDDLTCMKTSRYGAAVYPVLCLVNHSCDPNCVPVRSLKFLKTSVIAAKPLKAGDEVTFSYAPHFATMEFGERQKFLLERYNFRCTCEACIFAWGTDSRTCYIAESQCHSCGRYILLGQCPKCAQKDVTIRQRLNEVTAIQLPKIQDCIERGELVEALQLVAEELEFCHEAFSSNFNLCLEFYDLFKKLLVNVVSC